MKRITFLFLLATIPVLPLWSDPEGAPKDGSPGTLVGRLASDFVSEDEATRSRASETLVREWPGNLKVFSALIRHTDSRVREYALSCAGNLGSAAAPLVPSILEVLSDPDGSSRWRAAYELARIGPAAKVAAPELVRQMLDPGKRNQVAATWSVAALGESSWEALIETLREPSVILAARAFDKLSGPGIQIRGGDECAFGALMYALRRHAEPALRAQAARVLRRLDLPNPATEKALIEAALDDEHPDVRIAAAQALAETPQDRHPDILRSLREARHDADEKARKAILEALQKLGATAEDLK